MKNFIEYFYNIKIDKLIHENKYYSFKYNSYTYKLYNYYNDTNIEHLIDINRKMLNNTLVSEIIINKDGNAISRYNNNDYILLKIFINPFKEITLNEINFLSKSLYKENLNINWGILWEKKIDYLENLINENGKKYPLIVDSFNYFVGLAENAISYYNKIQIDTNYQYVISHKQIKIKDTIEQLYNPFNIIFDYKVRDIAEYIKISFFKNNFNIFNELNIYLKNNFLSLTDIKLLISRILYPSFYFDLYEDILIDEKEENIIISIINKLSDYENYLSSIIEYFKNKYNIEEILWLKKEDYR